MRSWFWTCRHCRCARRSPTSQCVSVGGHRDAARLLLYPPGHASRPCVMMPYLTVPPSESRRRRSRRRSGRAHGSLSGEAIGWGDRAREWWSEGRCGTADGRSRLESLVRRRLLLLRPLCPLCAHQVFHAVVEDELTCRVSRGKAETKQGVGVRTIFLGGAAVTVFVQAHAPYALLCLLYRRVSAPEVSFRSPTMVWCAALFSCTALARGIGISDWKTLHGAPHRRISLGAERVAVTASRLRWHAR